jgi:polysaccharide export outer membrane protein
MRILPRPAGLRWFVAAALVISAWAGPLGSPQVGTPSSSASPKPVVTSAATAAGIDVPAEYVVGPSDVLGIVFWRDADMTGDVTVRPDGRITLPIIGDISAMGLTPEQLKDQIVKAANKLFKEPPSVTVVVRTINSRKVYITGQVTTPGAHVLTGSLTVMQLISLAGGLTEFAKKKDITIMRTENGQPTVLAFNYQDVSRGKNLKQNVVLRPGDVVVVP